MQHYFFLLSLIFLLACNKTSVPSENTLPSHDNEIQEDKSKENYKECYQFDQRQCMTDKWADNFDLSLDAETKAKRMSAYLGTKGLSINRVIVNMQFHKFVCEACDTCPYEHRFFVEVAEKSGDMMSKLNLLNLSPCDCSTF